MSETRLSLDYQAASEKILDSILRANDFTKESLVSTIQQKEGNPFFGGAVRGMITSSASAHGVRVEGTGAATVEAVLNNITGIIEETLASTTEQVLQQHPDLDREALIARVTNETLEALQQNRDVQNYLAFNKTLADKAANFGQNIPAIAIGDMGRPLDNWLENNVSQQWSAARQTTQTQQQTRPDETTTSKPDTADTGQQEPSPQERQSQTNTRRQEQTEAAKQQQEEQEQQERTQQQQTADSTTSSQQEEAGERTRDAAKTTATSAADGQLVSDEDVAETQSEAEDETEKEPEKGLGLDDRNPILNNTDRQLGLSERERDAYSWIVERGLQGNVGSKSYKEDQENAGGLQRAWSWLMENASNGLAGLGGILQAAMIFVTTLFEAMGEGKSLGEAFSEAGAKFSDYRSARGSGDKMHAVLKNIEMSGPEDLEFHSEEYGFGYEELVEISAANGALRKAREGGDIDKIEQAEALVAEQEQRFQQEYGLSRREMFQEFYDYKNDLMLATANGLSQQARRNGLEDTDGGEKLLADYYRREGSGPAGFDRQSETNYGVTETGADRSQERQQNLPARDGIDRDGLEDNNPELPSGFTRTDLPEATFTVADVEHDNELPAPTVGAGVDNDQRISLS